MGDQGAKLGVRAMVDHLARAEKYRKRADKCRAAIATALTTGRAAVDQGGGRSKSLLAQVRLNSRN